MAEEGSTVQAPSLLLSVRVVGCITIVYGIFSLLNIIEFARHGRVFINLSALQLFAGIGILRRSRGWRLYQLFCLWFGIAMLTLSVISILIGRHLLTYGWMGIDLEKVRPEALLGIFLMLALFTLWEIRVLMRPDVKRLFGIPGT